MSRNLYYFLESVSRKKYLRIYTQAHDINYKKLIYKIFEYRKEQKENLLTLSVIISTLLDNYFLCKDKKLHGNKKTVLRLTT